MPSLLTAVMATKQNVEYLLFWLHFSFSYIPIYTFSTN